MMYYYRFDRTLDLLDKSEADCTKSLSIDPLYVKAWSRRGLTRFKQVHPLSYTTLCLIHNIIPYNLSHMQSHLLKALLIYYRSHLQGRYNESATDFYRALELDPDNKELPQLLQRAKDKFLEVEGRGEWHPSSSSSSSSSSSRGGHVGHSTVPQGHIKPTETNILPASSTAPAIVTSTETVISHHNVSTAGDLLLPSHCATMVTSGTCEIVTVNPNTTRTDGSPVNGDGSVASAGFTRVAISFDDDDDDDEEEEEQAEQPTAMSSPQQPPSPQKVKECDEQKTQTISAATMTAAAAKSIESELPPSSFTRMQIVVEDDSSDEEKSAALSSSTAAVLPDDVTSAPSPCNLAPSTVASGSSSPSMAALLSTLVELDVKLKDTPQVGKIRQLYPCI